MQFPGDSTLEVEVWDYDGTCIFVYVQIAVCMCSKQISNAQVHADLNFSKASRCSIHGTHGVKMTRASPLQFIKRRATYAFTLSYVL